MVGRQAVRWITIGFLYLAAASIVLVLFLSWPGVYGGKANLLDMVGGTADRPYVGRLVLPALVRLSVVVGEHASGVTGAEWARRSVEKVGALVLRRSRAPKHAFDDAYTYGSFAMVALFCFVGFAVTLRASIRSVYPEYPFWVSDLAPIVALMVMPVTLFRYVSFIYDPMTLFIFTVCLHLIAVRILPAYLLLFPLAVLSRETAILLLPVLLARGAEDSLRPRLVAVGVYHVVVFVGLRILLHYAFRHNPGAAFTLQVHRNLAVAGDPSFYVKTFAPLAPVALLIFYGWRRKRVFLRRAFLILGGTLVPLCLLFGSLGETRTYLELYPLAVLLAVPSAAHAFGWTERKSLPPGSRLRSRGGMPA